MNGPIVVTDQRQASATIRRLRSRHGISQQTLADRAGISQSVISALERDERGVKLPTFIALLDALGHDLAAMPREERA